MEIGEILLKGNEKRKKQIKHLERHKKNKSIHGHIFDADLLKKILDQPGVSKIMINHGVDEDGNHTVMINGMDINKKNNFDMMLVSPASCPPTCGFPPLTE